MKPYLLGLYEKAMPDDWDWPQKLKCAAQAGFDFVELSVDETPRRQERLQWDAAQRKAFAVLMRQELDISSLCLSAHRKYPIGSHFPEIRAKGMQLMERAVELAYDLGIRIIQLAGYDVYYKEESDEETKKYFTENLFRSARMASSRGVLLGLETMETGFMDTVEKAMAYVERIRSPYLGVYPDVGNLSNAVASVDSDLRRGAGHLLCAHLKETKPGVYRNLFFGEGAVNFPFVADALMELGVLRFTAEFWHLPGRDAARDIASVYAFLSDVLDPGAQKHFLNRKTDDTML